MKKFKYSEDEKKINNVLINQSNQLNNIVRPSIEGVNKRIDETEELLKKLGYEKELEYTKIVENSHKKKIISIPSWEDLCLEAEKAVKGEVALETLFTEDELACNYEAIKELNLEFNSLHRLDKIDYSISALASIVAGITDILLVGIPAKSYEGSKAGPLSNFIRDQFDKVFPQDEMEKLANSKASKVSYDAQDNRNTSEYIVGLSAYYHRLLALGHDPLLGFIIGVLDIMSGKMTTIDKNGVIVSQVMENYADRKEETIFKALAKQILHFKSDVTTSMGLPVPMMGLFNLLQFGEIGDEDQTIAEIVQGMYYEGYDFIHFCSMSIPAMLVEVIVRLCYSVKRIREGNKIKESIPFSLNRSKNPKLATMLFIGHSGATAINAGKVYFSGNPLAINYPQWLAFANYSYKQLKWSLLNKPSLRDAYVKGKIYEEMNEIFEVIDETYQEYASDYIFVFNG